MKKTDCFKTLFRFHIDTNLSVTQRKTQLSYKIIKHRFLWGGNIKTKARG